MEYSLDFIKPISLNRNYKAFSVSCRVLITPRNATTDPIELATLALSQLKIVLFEEIPGRESLDINDGMLRVFHNGVTSSGKEFIWSTDDLSSPLTIEKVDFSSPFVCMYAHDPCLAALR